MSAANDPETPESYQGATGRAKLLGYPSAEERRDPHAELMRAVSQAQAAVDAMADRGRARRPAPAPALPSAGEDPRLGPASLAVDDLLGALGEGDVDAARGAARRVVEALKEGTQL